MSPPPSSAASLREAAATTRSDLRQHVLILYSRPDGDFPVQDSQFELLRLEYARRVRMEVSSPGAAARRCGTWLSSAQPTFLVLHDNKIVSSAIGRISTRDLRWFVERAM